jgi:predicted nucleic acid-binding protein
MDQSLIEEAAEVAILFGLKAGDALYVAVAQRLNLPLVTFDHEQLTRPTSIITTISP